MIVNLRFSCVHVHVLYIYSELRSSFIKKYYCKRPSFFKFVQLLSTNNVKDLSNLGKFIQHGFDLRCNLI